MKRPDRNLRLKAANTVPEDATICHYDQLEDGIQQTLAHTVEGGARVTDELPATASLERHEFVKFTEYFRVQSRSETDAAPSQR